jgi:hypothetical protein
VSRSIAVVLIQQSPRHRLGILACKSYMNVNRVHMLDADNLPRISDHTDTLCFGLSVESGTLLEVLLTANSLGITETRLGESVRIAPS